MQTREEGNGDPWFKDPLTDVDDEFAKIDKVAKQGVFEFLRHVVPGSNQLFERTREASSVEHGGSHVTVKCHSLVSRGPRAAQPDR